MKTYCINCEHYYRDTSESRVSGKFYFKRSGGNPSIVCNSGVLMCQHLSCFKTTIEESNTTGKYKVSERIKGLHQLNEHMNCKYYKKEWWRFWIKNVERPQIPHSPFSGRSPGV